MITERGWDKYCSRFTSEKSMIPMPMSNFVNKQMVKNFKAKKEQPNAGGRHPKIEYWDGHIVYTTYWVLF